MIKPPSNHFQLGENIYGINNWANAVFVSPSILYASHACYSERVIALSSQWCVVIKVFVKPSSYYTSHDPTVIFDRNFISSEPTNTEYRVNEPEDNEYQVVDKSILSSIFRVLSNKAKSSEELENVIVKSVLFIDLKLIIRTFKNCLPSS